MNNVIDFKLEVARKIFKKHKHPLADMLVKVGEVDEEDGLLSYTGCTFDMNGAPLHIEDILGIITRRPLIE